MDPDQQEQQSQELQEKQYDYSHPIISIDFFLDPDQDQTGIRHILAQITNKYSGEPPQTIELLDDSNGSFTQFTNFITPFLTQFSQIFPHTSKSFIQVNQQQKLDDFIDKQESFISNEFEIEQEEELPQQRQQPQQQSQQNTNLLGIPVNYPLILQKLQLFSDLESSKILIDLINANKGKQPPDSEIQTQVEELVKNNTGLAGISTEALFEDKNPIRINYNLEVLKGAAYIGKFAIPAISGIVSVGIALASTDAAKATVRYSHIFVTKDGVLTDGFAVLPIKSSEIVTDGKLDTLKINNYAGLLKLSNADGNWLETSKQRVVDVPRLDDVIGSGKTTEYDRAVYFLGKDKIYGGNTISKRTKNKRITRRRK
jgi:hypothetical protein